MNRQYWKQCSFCGVYFRPRLQKKNQGKTKSKTRFQIICPRCGNSYDLKYRRSKKERISVMALTNKYLEGQVVKWE